MMTLQRLQDIPEGFGINVIGHVSANFGLGVSVRNVISILLERGCQVAVYDVDPGFGKHRHELTFEPYAVNDPTSLPHEINLVCLSIDLLPEFLFRNRSWLLSRRRMNVAWAVWELAELPDMWIRALELFDVVVAQSTFIREAMEFSLSGVRVISGDHPLYLQQEIIPDRRRFGLPEDGVLFFFSFDPHSDPERKNPFAVIDCFKRAFPDGGQAHLVIKMNSAETGGRDRPPELVTRLQALCAGDDRIHMFITTLSYDEVLSLTASCDVYVSLHRSEGLGLGMLEAMRLGKPVIATAWSGNMTFMDYTTSCPVRYRLILAESTGSLYSRNFIGKEVVWADADVEEAACWMRRLVADAGMRERIGRAALESSLEFQARAERGSFVDELIAVWEHGRAVDLSGSDRDKGLEALREAVFAHRLAPLSPVARLLRRTRRALDRNLLWRFRL